MEEERGKTHPVVLSGVGGGEIGSGRVGPVAARTFISGISRTSCNRCEVLARYSMHIDQIYYY
jgi:hypothetical protein